MNFLLKIYNLKMKPIYLDNAATTKVDERVVKAMLSSLKENYGNASSVHKKGAEAKEEIESARKVISKKINSAEDEIYFTSGSTESNNLSIKGLFYKNFPKKKHIITSKIEHDAVLETLKYLESKGAKVTYLDVDSEGFVDIKKLEKSITKETFLVTIMHANNEIGTIQPINEIGKICKEKKILFHTDATQSFTKIPIDVKKMNIDLLSVSSHKIHGPKGVGCLYIRKGVEIEPLLHGGGHERGIRSGTENVPGIVGFSKAVLISNEKDNLRIKKLRDKTISKIPKLISDVKLNGPPGELRLQNNINFSIEGVEGEAVGSYLESKGIYVSTGSACSSNTHSGSHVLDAIGLDRKEQDSAIRITLSKYTTEKEINYFLKVLPEIVEKLRGLRIK